MTLATRLVDFLDGRAALAAQRAADNAARDAFIVAQFPLLEARLEDQIRAAVGSHSRLAVTVTPQVLNVTGRTFTSLPRHVVSLTATVETAPLSLTFTPVLDFTHPNQFGRVECMASFEANLRRSRAAEIARSLLKEGIRMQGTSSAHLLIAANGAWAELSLSHLEDAFVALLLR